MALADKKLIILDRDGVINQDSEHQIRSVDQFISLPGSLRAIKTLNDAGKIVAVATNQSGIARGLFSLDTLQATIKRLNDLLATENAHLDAFVYCPHGPDDGCACRKPKAGLLQILLQRFNIGVPDAVFIGDAYRDLQAAHSIGMNAILVKTGRGKQTLQQQRISAPVYDDLAAAVEVLWGGYG